MKYEEYENRITEVLKNPDTALVEIKGVFEELKKDLTTLETLTVANADYEKRVKDLQDTNMKLFLSQGTKIDDSADPEEEPREGEAVIDEFLELVEESEENNG